MNKMSYIGTAIVALGIASTASADSVVMKYAGNTGLNSVSVSGNGSHSAGHLTYNIQNVGSYNTFCIETAQNTSSSYLTYEIVNLADAPTPGSPYGQAKADAVVQIIANAIDMGWIDMSLQATPGALNAAANADRMSAIQALIWDALVGDGNAAPSSGDAGTQANISSLLAFVPAQNSNTYNIMQSRLRAAVNDGAQDQLYVVPLPSAAWASLGMLGMCAGVRSIKRRR